MKRSNRIAAVAAVGGVLLHFVAPAVEADFSAAAVHRAAVASVVVVFAGNATDAGAAGAGSLVTADGWILTSDRLVFDPETGQALANIRVSFKPQRKSRDWKRDLEPAFPARVVARDERLGVALIQASKTPAGIPVLALSDSEALAVGATVASLGHPEGGGPWILSPGTLAGRGTRGEREVFVTGVDSGAGNVGAPLLDERGAWIGLSSGEDWVRGRLVGSWLEAQGLVGGSSRPGAERSVTLSATGEAEESAAEVPALLIAHGRIDVARSQGEAPRGFKGPNGEEMYGIARRDFRLSSFRPGLD